MAGKLITFFVLLIQVVSLNAQHQDEIHYLDLEDLDLRSHRPISFSDDANAVTLAIELLYFEANWTSTGNLIEWSAAYSNEAKFFLLEKTLDGEDFYPICVLDSGEEYYRYTDASFEAAAACYRLSWVTESGIPSVVSTVECVDRPIATDFEFVHHGASRDCVLRLNTYEPVNLYFRIFDQNGRMVFEREYIGADFLQEQLNLAGLRSGIYTVVAIIDQQKVVERIALAGN